MVNNPVYVEESVDRVPRFDVFKHVHVFNVYPVGPSGERVIYCPWDDFPELLNLEVHRDMLEMANELSLAFHKLGPHPDRERAQEIVDKLNSICEPSRRDMSPIQRWDRCAYHLPGDIGGENKRKAVDFVTSIAEGRVLEVMCGFNSYFLDSPQINEVVALDFSREMLKRYPFPGRKRILYDLERVVAGEKMDFFKEGSFQTIGCCYGINYLTDPVSVFREFRRILSLGGKLLILGNETAGYGDLIERCFNPVTCTAYMQEAGFLTLTIQKLDWLKTAGEFGDYYLVSGVK